MSQSLYNAPFYKNIVASCSPLWDISNGIRVWGKTLWLERCHFSLLSLVLKNRERRGNEGEKCLNSEFESIRRAWTKMRRRDAGTQRQRKSRGRSVSRWRHWAPAAAKHGRYDPLVWFNETQYSGFCCLDLEYVSRAILEWNGENKGNAPSVSSFLFFFAGERIVMIGLPKLHPRCRRSPTGTQKSLQLYFLYFLLFFYLFYFIFHSNIQENPLTIIENFFYNFIIYKNIFDIFGLWN